MGYAKYKEDIERTHAQNIFGTRLDFQVGPVVQHHPCDFCSFTATDKEQLERHLLKEHRDAAIFLEHDGRILPERAVFRVRPIHLKVRCPALPKGIEVSVTSQSRPGREQNRKDGQLLTITPPDEETTNDWQQFGQGLEQAQEMIRTLESAAQRPAYDGGIDYEKGFVDFQLQPIPVIKQSCQLLSWAVLYALKQGDLEAAHKDLVALVMLVGKQSPEPLVICQLVRRACEAYAFNATWQALQAEGWSDAQLSSLQSAWQRCDFVNDMAYAMEMERAMTLDYYDQIRHSRAKLDFVIQQHQKTQEMWEGAFGALPTTGFVLTWLHLPVWRMAWATQDELASLEQSQFMIERERLARTNGWTALAGAPERPKQLGWYDRLRFLFASENFSISDPMIRRTLEAQTQQQMTLAVLGLQRYRLKTGKLPNLLSDLVPEYLVALPHDFMNGKELVYRPGLGGDDFLLYSVGEDGKDDGGDPAQQKKSYRQIWDGRDAVWPRAAMAEEAKLAVGTGKHD